MEPPVENLFQEREFFLNAEAVIASVDAMRLSELEKRVRLVVHAMGIMP